MAQGTLVRPSLMLAFDVLSLTPALDWMHIGLPDSTCRVRNCQY
jgi:hypothetical protein